MALWAYSRAAAWKSGGMGGDCDFYACCIGDVRAGAYAVECGGECVCAVFGALRAARDYREDLCGDFHARD